MKTSPSFDLDQAKERLNEQISLNEATLAQLKTARSFLDKHDEIGSILDLVTKFGRPAKAPEPTTNDGSAFPTRVKDQVSFIVNHSTAPMRATDVQAVLKSHGVDKREPAINFHLQNLHKEKAIRRFSKGLYGALHAPANGHAIVDQAKKSAKGKLNYKEQAHAFKDLLAEALRKSGKPMKAHDLIVQLEADGHSFDYKDADKRVSYALNRIPGIKKHGGANRSRTYSLK